MLFTLIIYDICAIMQDLITSFLVQTKECSLPGIGKFSIVTTPAELDIARKKMFPPLDEILYTGKPDKISEDLVKYISIKKGLSQTEALETIKTWCKDAKEKLNTGEKIIFGSIGNLQKNASGNIFLQVEKPFNFFEPVPAERVIHKNTEHAVLVGDKETTSSVMNQFLQEEEIVKRFPWKIKAIILLAIALVILFIHFYSHSFSLSSTGNQIQHRPEVPAATYSAQ